MNEMAAIIYITVQDELKCFTIMANLIASRSHLKNFLLMDNNKIELEYKITDRLI